MVPGWARSVNDPALRPGSYSRRIVAGSTPLTSWTSRWTSRNWPTRSGLTAAMSGRPTIAPAGGRRERLLVVGLDGHLGQEARIELAREGRVQRRGEDRRRRHEGDPDRQRGRGLGGAGRVAHRVLATQARRHAPEPHERRADHPRQRPGDLRGQQRRADEQQQRPEPEQHVRVADAGEQPDEHQRHAEPGHDDRRRPGAAPSRRRSSPTSRSAAIGGIRLARIAGPQRRDQGHADPDGHRDDDRARLRPGWAPWAGSRRTGRTASPAASATTTPNADADRRRDDRR